MFNQNRIYRIFRLINLLKSAPIKSIKRIANSLEISERSTYRYLELLSDAGFNIQKDSSNKYWIDDNKIPSFTKEEIDLINQSISSNSNKNPLVKSIRLKLNNMGEVNQFSSLIVENHHAKIVSIINESIDLKQQVILIKYQSASSETVSDRLIEPITFSDNYDSFSAFELESQTIKSFKVERIGNVELLNTKFECEQLHVVVDRDIFGFNGAGKSFDIKLELSMRAMLWLKDDYPISVDYISQISDDKWILMTKVYSMEPVHRLIRSMPEDIISIN